MSADLFAAFGQTDQAQNPISQGSQKRSTTASTRTSGESILDQRDSSHTTLHHAGAPSGLTRIEPIFQPSNDGGNDILFDATVEQGERDDEFGDFEDVETYQTSSTEPDVSHPIAEVARLSTNDHGNVSAREKEATSLDLLSVDDTPTQGSFQPQRHTEDPTSAFDFFDARSNAPEVIPKTTSPPMHRQVDDDDTWGDFEAVPPQPAAPSPSPSGPRIQAHPAAPIDQANVIKAPRPPAPPPAEAEAEAEDWNTFEDSPATPSPATYPPASSASKATSISTSTSAIPINAQRPTNVPPPSILLSLLPTTFSSLLALILSTSESSSPPSADRSTPAISTEDLPNLIQTTYRTSTRIISTPARTLRWRRDALLSQSTRIGVAGKPGGMKLSSLNKGESAREEREAAEAVESWNSKIHHFSRVLQTSGVKLQGGLKLSMMALVKPLTGAGVIQATLVCPVCGLKRSERLVGVDEGVEDVFGEYWHENWGHRDCAEWWYRWSSELAQR